MTLDIGNTGIIPSMKQAVSVYDDKKESDLIKKAREGDRAAFEELFKMHSNKVFSIAYRVTGNASDAEDLCQEVFMQVIRKIDSFQGRSSFSTWLYRITVNRSRDCLRKKKRSHESLAKEDDAQNISERVPASYGVSPGPETSVIEQEQREQIQQSLAELPLSLRVPLVLHELEELQYGEISTLLRLPLGTVKSRIFRARVKLAEIINSKDEQND
ncbi:MAG: sigma-70 family RNA polymerase sigma factor [Actinobacteria bacterium]|nr:sigma-70 family RNA polymerase sigma factor [Actinomycetota bacterium]